jgi:hypothetical protein
MRHVMRSWGNGVIASPFLTLVLYGGEWSATRPCFITPEETALGTHSIGGWVDSRAGLDSMEKKKSVTPWEIEP